MGYFLVVIISTALSVALAPSPPRQANAEPGQFKRPTVPTGDPVTVAWGTVWEKSPKVIFFGNVDQSPIMSNEY